MVSFDVVELSRQIFERGSCRRAVGALAFCIAGVGLGGCSGQPPIAEVVSASSAHFESFARFERWATRMLGSDVRLQGPLALREATFAPLRSDPDVLWAEVRESERQLLQYPKPEPTPAEAKLRFVTVEAPAVGRLSVALSDACRAPNARAVPCVVIARPEGEGEGHEVRVAFRRGLTTAARAEK